MLGAFIGFAALAVPLRPGFDPISASRSPSLSKPPSRASDAASRRPALTSPASRSPFLRRRPLSRAFSFAASRRHRTPAAVMRVAFWARSLSTIWWISSTAAS